MRKDTWIKAVSVLFAVALWMFVISRGQTDISLEVQVGFRGVPAGLQPAGGKPRTVTVGIRGHERFIKELNPGDVHVYVDMGGLGRGVHQLRIRSRNVKLPSPLRVVSVTPSSLNVQLEESLRKTVPVRAVVTGRPGEGFEAASVEVMPPEVVVEGVVSEVRRVKAVETVPVDITLASDTVVKDARIVRPGGSMSAEPDSVTVKVVIVKERE
jgi:YbbR domain-containing protein